MTLLHDGVWPSAVFKEVVSDHNHSLYFMLQLRVNTAFLISLVYRPDLSGDRGLVVCWL